LHSKDTPIEILEEDPSLVTSSINFTYPVTVQDVNVYNVSGTHEYVGDLLMSLEFNNKSTILISEICSDSKNFNLGFDDESNDTSIPCPPTDGKLYRPEQGLNVYDKLLAGGEWKMNIEDVANFDGGELQNWSLQVCFSKALSSAIIPSDHNIKYCEGQDVYFDAFYSIPENTKDFTIKIFNRNNEELTSSFSIIQGNLDLLNIRLESNTLTDERTDVRLELIDLDSGQTLGLSVVNLVKSGFGVKPDIEFPSDNDSFSLDELKEISWTSGHNGFFKIEIARDADFNDLVLVQEGQNANVLSLENRALLPGSYFLRVKNIYACGTVVSDVIRIKIDQGTSAQHLDEASVVVWPNPTEGLLYVDCQNLIASNCVIDIVSLDGKIMTPEFQWVSEKLLLIDVTSFESGVYILRLRHNDIRLQQMIVKV
jgi:hypothetical protein